MLPEGYAAGHQWSAQLESWADDDHARVPTGMFRHVDAWLNHPTWLRIGTELGPGLLPLFVPLATASAIVDNIVSSGQAEHVLALLLHQQATAANPVSASLLDHAPNAREGLMAVVSYTNATHPHLLMSCDVADGHLVMKLHSRMAMSRPAMNLLAAMFVSAVCRYLARFGAPPPGDLKAEAPGHAALLSDRLGMAIADRPGHPCRISVASSFAARANPGHDPQGWQMAMDRLRELEQAGHRSDLVVLLEQAMASGLMRTGRLPTLGQAARSIGVSERTLSRRLAELDLGIRDVGDRVRQRLARQLIAQPRTSLNDISTRLGFSDQSSFSRHFKRWFGESPARYRRGLESEKRAT